MSRLVAAARFCGVAGIGVMLAGCGNSLTERQDQAVASALPYDSVPCETLFMHRDALAAQYGLPQNARPVFVRQPYGMGPLTPDVRSERRRKTEAARGEIDAMNRSLTRRKCAAPTTAFSAPVAPQ
ncbi:hypothetical protein [Aquamicrobium ahrensii]|uniref:Lipoprotein n=1 Tax=Aquamicrobium ahrensii TaxID=469551 RepID=A0ABV2KM75_9HYPH